MAMNQALLGEFDHEMANTRKALQRVPEEKLDWKPHAKSFSMGALAAHIAFIPQWAKMTMETPQFDLNPPGGRQVQPPAYKSRAELLAAFDQGVSEARAAIAAATDQSLSAPWSLLSGGQNVFTMPRVAVLRSMIFNHLIHHRGQLTVYLRLNDVAVPPLYGPTADEGGR